MSATSLISQRELAESQLRASMFRDLIGPIMQTTAGGKNGAKIVAETTDVYCDELVDLVERTTGLYLHFLETMG
jgi:hypothetical protein